MAFILLGKVVFASLLKKEELDFISVAWTITWGFFLQVEPGLFPSNFFFVERCAWQITFATKSSLFSFIVSLSLSSTSASYCLQEIDAFPGVQIVSLLWTSDDKKLCCRVSNDFIPFLQIFADPGLLRSTSWLCVNGFLFVRLALILSLGAGLYKDFLEIPEFEPLVTDAILKFPTIGLGSVFL